MGKSYEGKHRPEAVKEGKKVQAEVKEWTKVIDNPPKSPNQPRATGPTLE